MTIFHVTVVFFTFCIGHGLTELGFFWFCCIVVSGIMFIVVLNSLLKCGM